MLHIKDLHAEIGGKEILHGISLHIEPGETHVLMGPNGSGKSTLLMCIMGFDAYKITKGSIIFNGDDVTHLPVHERARLGIVSCFSVLHQSRALNLARCLK